MPGSPRSRTAGLVLLWLCAVATVLAASIAVTGGLRFEVLGIRISMHAMLRPIVVALVSGVAGSLAARGAGSAAPFDRLEPLLQRGGLPIACVFAAVIGVTAYQRGAHIAGGADASGYLSQARLWRAGSLRVETPLARELKLVNGQYPFTPIGYQPSADPGAAVPGYPPGLPILFALAGERGQFLVVPLSAAGVVVVAFLLGRRIGGPDTALIAAAACGSSAILLFQAHQPMSDVPAAFWWSLAAFLLTGDSILTAVAAGLVAAVACVVRPNLFAMAPVLGVLSMWWAGWNRRGAVRASLFLLPVVAAGAAFTYLQRSLYGSATTTGYGAVSGLFSLEHVVPNLALYAEGIVFLHSPLLLAALAGPLAIARGWVTPGIDRTRAVRIACSALLCFVALQGFYLLYLVFEGWTPVRFLLPALPLLLVVQAAALAAACRGAPLSTRSFAVIVVAVLMASWGVGKTRGLGVFQLVDSELRYRDVAEFVRGLPPDAVCISLQHSGSLPYYAGATVLRWDWIEPDEIDRAVSELAARGRATFAVLDEGEEVQFRRRFAGSRTAGRLVAPPLFATGASRPITARVYAVSGTTAAAAGAPFSSPPPLAPQNPRTPAAPARGPGSASSDR